PMIRPPGPKTLPVAGSNVPSGAPPSGFGMLNVTPGGTCCCWFGGGNGCEGCCGCITGGIGMLGSDGSCGNVGNGCAGGCCCCVGGSGGTIGGTMISGGALLPGTCGFGLPGAAFAFFEPAISTTPSTVPTPARVRKTFAPGD